MNTLIESLRAKFSQLKFAVADGEDQLVRIIDREIEPLVARLYDAQPVTPRELYLQVRYFCELTRDNARDPAMVRRNMSAMIDLLDRSFRKPGSQFVRRLMPVLRKPVQREQEDDIHLYQGMLDVLPDQVLLVGRERRVLFANRTFCEQHRCRPHDCIGRQLDEYEFGNAVPDDFDIKLEACLADRDPVTPATTAALPPTPLLERIILRPFRVGTGLPIAVVVIIRSGTLLLL
ncbi:PAS domain-containing protein [Rhizobium sp. KVB221]|uniref:PAS domain-containing protein n=1 Tax=Rhizobium setariae TaxID=2801340 RepID=A0A936YRZ1_9HYPH|nr:PAS domain-containing protein [Rhizobium setariae]MBL0373144.1 PAS domain-containing protein [Rhizobium setariae]